VSFIVIRECAIDRKPNGCACDGDECMSAAFPSATSSDKAENCMHQTVRVHSAVALTATRKRKVELSCYALDGARLGDDGAVANNHVAEGQPRR
jgi:hypothetical protein